MIDRLFMLTLTFAVLAAGSLAIGSEYLSSRHPPAVVVQLPRVVVTGKVQPARTEVASAQIPATGASATAQ